MKKTNNVISVEESHEILEFVEGGNFAVCSCGQKHPLNKRAHQAWKNNESMELFEYCDLNKSIMLTKDVEEILKSIGGLFH